MPAHSRSTAKRKTRPAPAKQKLTASRKLRGEPPARVPASVAIRLQPASEFTSAAEYFPPSRSIAALERAARGCRACDLWRTGSQTVFGAGGRSASVVFLGEQPGDQEDREGAPFVGPAGRLLDELLGEAGLDRSEAYVTNVVKHFKWEPMGRGERRLHKKPSEPEIRACKPWLEAEVEALRPRVLVCLGATAAQAVLGKSFRVTRDRGKPQRPPDGGPVVIATVHPSSVLRTPGSEARRAARAALVADLRVVAREAKGT
jgi:uracil-DNA glycosylase family protein